MATASSEAAVTETPPVPLGAAAEAGAVAGAEAAAAEATEAASKEALQRQSGGEESKEPSGKEEVDTTTTTATATDTVTDTTEKPEADAAAVVAVAVAAAVESTTAIKKVDSVSVIPITNLSRETLAQSKVAFAYLTRNKESCRVALTRQTDFFLQEGTLHLTVEEGETQTNTTVEQEIASNNSKLIMVAATYNRPKRSARKSTEAGRNSTKTPPAKKKATPVKKAVSGTKRKAAQAASPARATRSAKKETPPAKAKTASTKKTPRTSSASKKNEDNCIATITAPEDELKGLKWTRKEFVRTSGATKGSTDKYWYTPKTQKRLRSMAEVRRFLNCLKKSKGDEDKAFTLLKDGFGA